VSLIDRQLRFEIGMATRDRTASTLESTHR